ncbi:MAG: hypothetical protein P8020_13345 [Acidobacteriota bacterium]|jgi:DNA-binding response OmpR family regulator
MKTILLIESDESLRRRFRKFLEFENYRVLSVKDESFALEFLSGQDIDIDLVILGVSSEPEPLFEELIEGLSNTKVLLLSSSASTAVSAVYPCLTKPVPPERLVAKVHQLLHARTAASA